MNLWGHHVNHFSQNLELAVTSAVFDVTSTVAFSVNWTTSFSACLDLLIDGCQFFCIGTNTYTPFKFQSQLHIGPWHLFNTDAVILYLHTYCLDPQQHRHLPLGAPGQQWALSAGFLWPDLSRFRHSTESNFRFYALRICQSSISLRTFQQNLHWRGLSPGCLGWQQHQQRL